MKYISKTITAIVFVLFLASVCAIDSGTWLPAIIAAVSGLLLSLNAYHAGWIM